MKATAVVASGSAGSNVNSGQDLFDWSKKVLENEPDAVVMITEWSGKNVPRAAIKIKLMDDSAIPVLRVAEIRGVTGCKYGEEWPAVASIVPEYIQMGLAKLRPGWILDRQRLARSLGGMDVDSGNGFLVLKKTCSRKGAEMVVVIAAFGSAKHRAGDKWAAHPLTNVPADIREKVWFLG